MLVEHGEWPLGSKTIRIHPVLCYSSTCAEDPLKTLISMTVIFRSIVEIVVTRGIIIKTLNFHLTLHTNILTTLGYA